MGETVVQRKWAAIVADFKKHKIQAFVPGEREYELSVATGNLLYRFTRPDCVVQPENAHEIGYIIKKAQKPDVQTGITVKCGGHSYTGFSTANRGILMDLKRMTDVQLKVDKDDHPTEAIVSAGARWGDVYRTLIHDSHRGYIINGGRCPSVGVSGFLLGGGLGPFTRQVGMGSDTVLGIKIVTADGEEKEVSEKTEPDLFWALRGGGCANFGVVTEFRLKAEQLRGKNVVAGRYTWMPLAMTGVPENKKEEELKTAKKNLEKTMKAFYGVKWPAQMTIDSNWMMDVHGGKGEFSIRFIVYFDGDLSQFQKVINEHFVDDDSQNPNGDKIVNKVLKAQLLRRCMEEPSTRFLYETLVMMWEEEARFALPRPGENLYQKYASFCFEHGTKVSNGVVDIVRSEQTDFERDFRSDSASLWVTFIHSGGRAAEIKPEATAFPWRNCTFQTYVTLKWTDKWVEQEATKALVSIKNKLKDFSMTHQGGEPAAFINFSDATLGAGKHEKAYYGPNQERLQKVKAKYDPTGFFKNPWDRILQLPDVKSARQDAAGFMSVTSEWLAATDTTTNVGDDETVFDDAELERIAKEFTDLIAKNDWDSFTLPPGDLTEIYGQLYVDDF